MRIQSGIYNLKWRLTPVFLNFRNFLTGVHPHTRISHPQFLVNENLRLLVEKKLLGTYTSDDALNILDVGCGSKPYSYVFPGSIWYGIDIYDGPYVDLVVNNNTKWSIPNEQFQFVLCTEVLEHAESPEFVLKEILRVMKPGAFALLTTPFIYGVHGEPSDFRRYTPFGLIQVSSAFEVIESGLLGGIGSSTVIGVNNWISLIFSKKFSVEVVLLPIFLIHCIFVNLIAKFFDRIDNTNKFGTNSWILLRKDGLTCEQVES